MKNVRNLDFKWDFVELYFLNERYYVPSLEFFFFFVIQMAFFFLLHFEFGMQLDLHLIHSAKTKD